MTLIQCPHDLRPSITHHPINHHIINIQYLDDRWGNCHHRLNIFTKTPPIQSIWPREITLRLNDSCDDASVLVTGLLDAMKWSTTATILWFVVQYAIAVWALVIFEVHAHLILLIEPVIECRYDERVREVLMTIHEWRTQFICKTISKHSPKFFVKATINHVRLYWEFQRNHNIINKYNRLQIIIKAKGLVINN